MELKYYKTPEDKTGCERFNCTFMELKYMQRVDLENRIEF